MATPSVQKPSGKTKLTGAVGGISGVGLAPLIIWILGQFGLEMDPETAAVAGGLIGALASTTIAYFVPAKSGKYVDIDATPVPDDYRPKH